MEDLRSEAFKLLASLTEEQLERVLAYARVVQAGGEDLGGGLEELLEEPA
jgi:hypothetical protein